MSEAHALDLFCGAGGAARGLQNAGFHVTGVDVAPQPHYAGDVFIQADVTTIHLDDSGHGYLHIGDNYLNLLDFNFIWASPPCQRFTQLQHARQRAHMHPDLIGSTRELLVASGRPYCIENVPGAPLINPKQLCGIGLGLAVKRHRWFETNFFFMTPPCPENHEAYDYWVIAGHEARLNGRREGAAHSRRKNDIDGAKEAMLCPWMTREELREAIPPPYAEFIGSTMRRIFEI